MQNIYIYIYIYIYVYVYVYVFSPAVVIASRLMQPAKRCDCRDHFSYCHTFHTSAIRECTFLHLPLRLVIYFSPVPAFVHKTYFLFRGISFNLPARFHFMADISERISLHSISKLAKKKKKFDDGDGDGTKSRVDRARFVLPAPSLIHSGPSIERIKCRVSDAMRKKNCAARPWFTFITLFAPRLVLRLVAPINQQRTLFACIPAPEINKSRYSIIGKNIRGGF